MTPDPQGSPTAPHAQTLAILLGASSFPGHAPFADPNTAFANAAARFRAYLVTDMGLVVDDTLLDLFNDHRPFRELVDAIRAFLTGHPNAQNLIFYYVGHGVLVDGGAELALYIHDTAASHPLNTSVRVDALWEALGGDLARRRRQYLVIDACYSGMTADHVEQRIRQTTAGAGAPLALPVSGTSVLSSTTRDEDSLAPTGWDCTLFTRALLEVLRNGYRWGDPTGLTLYNLATAINEWIEQKSGLVRRPV